MVVGPRPWLEARSMSSKRRIRRNQCGRKVRHADEAAARRAIFKLAQVV